jgi:hypothetical protein
MERSFKVLLFDFHGADVNALATAGVKKTALTCSIFLSNQVAAH